HMLHRGRSGARRAGGTRAWRGTYRTPPTGARVPPRMKHPVTLIAGDGIGPEVADAARAVVDATGVEILWVEREAGAGAIARAGDPLPDDVLQSIRETRVALKG